MTICAFNYKLGEARMEAAAAIQNDAAPRVNKKSEALKKRWAKIKAEKGKLT